MEILSKHINGEGLAKLYRILVGELDPTIHTGNNDSDRLDNMTDSELVFHNGKFGVKYSSGVVWLNDVEIESTITTLAQLLNYNFVADTRSPYKVLSIQNLKNIIEEALSSGNQYYGPYSNLGAALLAIPLSDREWGMTFAVQSVSGLTEYWWESSGDLTNSVISIKGGSSSGIPKPYEGDQKLTPNNTSGDEVDTGITLSEAPMLNSRIDIYGNGEKLSIGNGVKTESFYFSRDGGVNALAFSDLQLGDGLFYNGTICHLGDLDSLDVIDVNYHILS